MTRLEGRQILVRDIEQACADGRSPARPGLCPGRHDARTLRRWKAGDGLRRVIGGRMPIVRSSDRTR